VKSRQVSGESNQSAQPTVTRKHVGSLFSHTNTSRNNAPYKSSEEKQNEVTKDYRKGVILRRSLAQNPPIFNNDPDVDSTFILEVDKSINKPIIIKLNDKSPPYIKNESLRILKITPKNSGNKFSEAAVEKGRFNFHKHMNEVKPINQPNVYMLNKSNEWKLDHDTTKNQVLKRPESKVNKRLFHNWAGDKSPTEKSIVHKY
jgi:hypothetical protein